MLAFWLPTAEAMRDRKAWSMFANVAKAWSGHFLSLQPDPDHLVGSAGSRQEGGRRVDEGFRRVGLLWTNLRYTLERKLKELAASVCRPMETRCLFHSRTLASAADAPLMSWLDEKRHGRRVSLHVYATWQICRASRRLKIWSLCFFSHRK